MTEKKEKDSAWSILVVGLIIVTYIEVLEVEQPMGIWDTRVKVSPWYQEHIVLLSMPNHSSL